MKPREHAAVLAPKRGSSDLSDPLVSPPTSRCNEGGNFGINIDNLVDFGAKLLVDD